MSQPSKDESVLTVSKIRSMRAEYEEAVRIAAEKKANYEGALKFATAEQRETILANDDLSLPFVPPPSRKNSSLRSRRTAAKPAAAKDSAARRPKIRATHNSKKTWPGAIMKVFDNAERGLSHKEALEELKNVGMRARIEKNVNGYYGAILKLIANNFIVKRDDLYYSAPVLNKLEKSGMPLPAKVKPEIKHREGGSSWFVLRALEKSGSGLTAQEIKDTLSKEPNAPASVKKHSQFIYGVLGTLVGTGAIVKQDDRFYMAKKGEARPGTNGSSLVAHA